MEIITWRVEFLMKIITWMDGWMTVIGGTAPPARIAGTTLWRDPDRTPHAARRKRYEAKPRDRARVHPGKAIGSETTL